MSAWQPRDSGECIDPGIANTSRPCSSASLAVIKEPDASAASTTRQPLDKPLMILLRRGKLKWGHAKREFRNDGASSGNFFDKFCVGSRIGYVSAASEHGYG